MGLLQVTSYKLKQRHFLTLVVCDILFVFCQNKACFESEGGASHESTIEVWRTGQRDRK